MEQLHETMRVWTAENVTMTTFLTEGCSHLPFLVLLCIPWVFVPIISAGFLLSTYHSWRHFYKIPRNIPWNNLPGVSIIKPLKGVDRLLEENVESHFTLQYPKFELLIGVQDPLDPAVELVKRLQLKYPHVDSKLIIGGKDGIVNPMVNNMAPQYDVSKYDIIWISSSRVKGSGDMLIDMVTKLQSKNTALVFQLPYMTTTFDQHFRAWVQKMQFGVGFGRYMVAGNLLGFSIICGMSYVFKKPELDKIGGMDFFGKYLSEDFFIAEMLHERGFKHRVAAIPSQQNVEDISYSSFLDRMIRWYQLRITMTTFAAVFMEPMGQTLIFLPYLSWSASCLFGVDPWRLFTTLLVTWCFLDYVLIIGVQGQKPVCGVINYIGAWSVHQIFVVLIILGAMCKPFTVTWAGKTYRVNMGGTIGGIVGKSNNKPQTKTKSTPKSSKSFQNGVHAENRSLVENHNLYNTQLNGHVFTRAN